jgi:dephospho-CoA kinase
MRTLGLTGGVATGKSTVADLLREAHGVPVLDADAIAREIVAPGQPALAEIQERFGAEMLNADGTLDRSRLREHIVSDAAARADLEAITHPRIGARMFELLGALRDEGTPLAFVEAALMVETGTWRLYEALWVVTCSPDLQRERLVARDGVSEADALGLIATQLPLAEKEALASEVLRNEGDLSGLRQSVAAAFSRLHP